MNIGLCLACSALIASLAASANAAGPERHQGTCSLLAGNSLTVEDCTIEVSANAFSAIYLLTWQSGDTTEIKLSNYGNSVNGEPAVEIPAPADIEAGSECFETRNTKDIYCSKIPGLD
ncbi:hypothetical protein [Roseibium sp. Sym1]|uniref:hypothetical protein n=1 Tax=Roseibium sp. Sym1 TaxID=3016006 RepID=UPI0022B4DB7F|nr:hypothetical protein [Roseibium sp. Sym1]